MTVSTRSTADAMAGAAQAMLEGFDLTHRQLAKCRLCQGVVEAESRHSGNDQRNSAQVGAVLARSAMIAVLSGWLKRDAFVSHQ